MPLISTVRTKKIDEENKNHKDELEFVYLAMFFINYILKKLILKYEFFLKSKVPKLLLTKTLRVLVVSRAALVAGAACKVTFAATPS